MPEICEALSAELNCEDMPMDQMDELIESGFKDLAVAPRSTETREAMVAWQAEEAMQNNFCLFRLELRFLMILIMGPIGDKQAVPEQVMRACELQRVQMESIADRFAQLEVNEREKSTFKMRCNRDICFIALKLLQAKDDPFWPLRLSLLF